MYMKEEILKLRSEGKTYKEIQKELGCSLSTICYYCGDNQPEKIKVRKNSNLKTLRGILKRKKDNFSFVHRTKGKKGYTTKRVPLPFSSKEFFDKITSNPVCYLTGRNIDLLSPKTYQCDHIMPVCKGGQSVLENLGLTCKEANLAKNELTLEEFLNLCKEILIHNGFDVIKKED